MRSKYDATLIAIAASSLVLVASAIEAPKPDRARHPSGAREGGAGEAGDRAAAGDRGRTPARAAPPEEKKRTSAAAGGCRACRAAARAIQSDGESPRGLSRSRSRSTSEESMKTRYPKEFLFSLGSLLAASDRDSLDLDGLGATERAGGARSPGRIDAQGSELRSATVDVRDHEGLGAGELRHPDDLGARDDRLQESHDAARTGAAGRRSGARAGGHADPAGGHARVRPPARVADRPNSNSR